MSNNLLTISMITQEALAVIENELTFTSEVNREYDDRFAITGAKIGNTVNVRRPGRFIGTIGPALSVEDFNETSIPVTLTTQFHVDTQMTTQDLALSMDMFSDRLLKPAIATIANKVDSDGLLLAANNTANIVGIAGTPPTGLITYLTAAAYMDSEGAPRDGRRSVIIEPFTSATIVDSLKGLFVPSETISVQYKKGLMGRDSAGMNWKMDQNVLAHQYGAWAGTAGALTVSGANQGLSTGWAPTSTLILNSTQIGTLNQGDTIQIAGVFGVNPQNRRAYGSNRQRNFVLTAPVTFAANGNAIVTVSPALIYGGQFQNVTSSPIATAAVTPFSMSTTAAAAQISPQNILMHKNAFTLAMADLDLPEGVHFAGRAADKETGISIRIVRQYTINNDAIPTRIDVLYGWSTLYPEWACRIAA